MNTTKTPMTPEAQRIAIAEAVGWRWLSAPHPRDGQRIKAFFPPDFGGEGWQPSDGTEPECCEEWVLRSTQPLPDFPNDLNAIQSAVLHVCEKKGWPFQERYQTRLQEVVERRRRQLNEVQLAFWTTHATAAQRCEAFLRTIGKWEQQKAGPEGPA